MNRLWNLRFTFFILVVFWGGSFSLVSQELEVDRDELQSIGDSSVKFINYTGPHDFINSLDEIRAVGRSLGSLLQPDVFGTASIPGKYQILHIISPEILEKRDADILILEAGAAVDHINNLRTILAGYLEETYDYEARDALLLAEFITYYNAVYRGDLDYLARKYKAPVMAVLEESKAGLATHYAEWPGKTQIVIPLGGFGSSPLVDTEAISNKEVIEEMRQEEDRGLDSRKDMVELREKEIDKEQESLDEKKKALEEKSGDLNENIQELEKTPEEARDSEDQQKIEEMQAEKDAVDKEREDLESEQKALDKKTDDTLRMRDEIAEDETELLEEKKQSMVFVPPPEENPAWFLLMDDPGDGIPYGRIVKYDQAQGKRLAVSETTAVRGRSFILLPKSVLVIAGKESGTSLVRPLLLDPDTLEIKKEGTQDVFPGSLIGEYKNHYFMVTMEEGEWRVSKFNANLDQVAVSLAAVEPWTSMAFQNSLLYVQGAQGKIHLLNPERMDLVSTLE